MEGSQPTPTNGGTTAGAQLMNSTNNFRNTLQPGLAVETSVGTRLNFRVLPAGYNRPGGQRNLQIRRARLAGRNTNVDSLTQSMRSLNVGNIKDPRNLNHTQSINSPGVYDLRDVPLNEQVLVKHKATVTNIKTAHDLAKRAASEINPVTQGNLKRTAEQAGLSSVQAGFAERKSRGPAVVTLLEQEVFARQSESGANEDLDFTIGDSNTTHHAVRIVSYAPTPEKKERTIVIEARSLDQVRKLLLVPGDRGANFRYTNLANSNPSPTQVDTSSQNDRGREVVVRCAAHILDFLQSVVGTTFVSRLTWVAGGTVIHARVGGSVVVVRVEELRRDLLVEVLNCWTRMVTGYNLQANSILTQDNVLYTMETIIYETLRPAAPVDTDPATISDLQTAAITEPVAVRYMETNQYLTLIETEDDLVLSIFDRNTMRLTEVWCVFKDNTIEWYGRISYHAEQGRTDLWDDVVVKINQFEFATALKQYMVTQGNTSEEFPNPPGNYVDLNAAVVINHNINPTGRGVASIS